MKLPIWFESVRAVLAVLVIFLLFVVVIGFFLGGKLPAEVLSLVSMVISGIVMAYFGKRDSNEESRTDPTKPNK